MKELGPDPTLHLPRILCFHGGGVNAEVFRHQCRGLRASLRQHFRLVFVDGPFFSVAHHSIVEVYGDFSPFRRWLRWLPNHPKIDAAAAISGIQYQIRIAMRGDDDLGATGPWAGLLGFSQGATVAASLLYTQQKLMEQSGKVPLLFHFAVLLAGQPPLVMLDEKLQIPRHVADAGATGVDFNEWPESDTETREHVLRLPTIHVHGLTDPGLEYYRILLNGYCGEGTTRLIEWDGDHRVPIDKSDLDLLSKEILLVGMELGFVNEEKTAVQ